MALIEQNIQPIQQTVDLRISIPELSNVSAFWMRNYPTHRNFAELYQDCVNHAEVARERKTLEKVRASRHFWFNDVMLCRSELLDTFLTQNKPHEGKYREISLVLRRDFYRIQPANLLKTKSEHIYINAESPVREIVAEIMISDECPACFDLCTHRKKRIGSNRSLADERLWPAWEDAPADEFPLRAHLLLRPRVSLLPYVLYGAALIVGALVGYHLIAVALVR